LILLLSPSCSGRITVGRQHAIFGIVDHGTRKVLHLKPLKGEQNDYEMIDLSTGAV
jgi:hypothetical protein